MTMGKKILIMYIVMTFLTAGCATHSNVNYERASWHADQLMNRVSAMQQIGQPCHQTLSGCGK